MPSCIAVDLGATSGRVVNATFTGDTFELDLVRRFPTSTVPGPDGALAWDFESVLRDIRQGLSDAAERVRPESIAIDSWAIDYGLLDDAGQLLGPVHAYRSSRTDGVMQRVCAGIGRERIYDITGVQFLPFNTIYQLASARETVEYQSASGLLMVPDLVNAVLCGSRTNELTNASTTQLLDINRREWSDELVVAAGLRRDLLLPLHEPGQHLGEVDGVDSVVDGLRVVAAASHDTASAVAGTPLRRGDRPAVYISCGTWALVGCELSAPVTSAAALEANVTNELGVDGSVRLLRNVTGLWLIEECRRMWAAGRVVTTSAELVVAAANVPAGRSVFDPDDARLATARDMPAEIASICRDTGQVVPQTPAEFTRAILESLALKWRSTIVTIERVAGFDAEVVHLVGGGSAIPLLAELCASATGRTVLAGPVEATIAGNAIVQAVAAGWLRDVEHGRRLVERALPCAEVMPRPLLDWDGLAARLVAPRGR